MKRFIYILLVYLFCSIFSYANNLSNITIQRTEDKTWIVEDGIKTAIDEKVVLVKPKSKDAFLRLFEAKELGFGIYELEVPDAVKVEDYVLRLEKTGCFECVDYNNYFEYALTPNDGTGTGQWYLGAINAYDAWNITTGNPNIKVAVLDSGVDSTHYDLGYGNDNYTHLSILEGYNYPNNVIYSNPTSDHGTRIAGLIGAKSNNWFGIAGLSGGNYSIGSAGITIIPYCVGLSSPQCNYVISAVSNAVSKGAKIIVMSFRDYYSNNSLISAINSAYQNGVTIVCATGNENASVIPYPARLPETIAVGATNQNGNRYHYLSGQGSNYGYELDLVAPGVDILTTTTQNNTMLATGTSIAASQVAGVAALMLSVNPTLSPDEIKSKLRNTCTKLPSYTYSSGWNIEVGCGLLNAYMAVYAAQPHEIVGPKFICSSEDYYIDNLPSGVSVTWTLSDSYYNSNCLTVNPTSGHCTITHDPNHNMINATLNAYIWYNDKKIHKTTKTDVNAYNGFRGHYTSGNLSGDFTNYTYVNPNVQTYITSKNFIGATISYDNNLSIPTYWCPDTQNGSLRLVVPTSMGNMPVNVCVDDACGNHYTLTLIPSGAKSLNVISRENYIIVTLDNSNYTQKSYTINKPWNYEIRNATTGELKIVQTMESSSAYISTSGWSKGLYIVKATINKDVISEKVIVR